MPPCISTVSAAGSSQNPPVVTDPDTVTSGASGNGGPDLAPVVLVGGFLLPPTTDFDALYWGEALNCRENGRVIPVHPSPIASLHDRVCQIFYELKGGQVDYGQEHSEHYGHDRLGTKHEKGLYPEWDAAHPVHLLGHSFGGVTVRLLLHYLSHGLFPGHATSPSWVLSIISLNSPHNGTRLVYGLGADLHAPPLVHWGSVGHVLTLLAHVVEFVDLPWLRKYGLDFGLAYWRWSRREGLGRGLLRVLEAGLGSSRLGTSHDNAAHDMTVHAAAHLNTVMDTEPSVTYLSFVGTLPSHAPPPAGERDLPTRRWLKRLAYSLMRWHVHGVAKAGEGHVCSALPPITDWAHEGVSDGVVSVFSQAFPRLPHPHRHHPCPSPSHPCCADHSFPLPGMWHVSPLPVDHVGIVGYPSTTALQKAFFTHLYETLQHVQQRPKAREKEKEGNAFPTPEDGHSDAATAPLKKKRRYPWSTVLTALHGESPLPHAPLSKPQPGSTSQPPSTGASSLPLPSNKPPPPRPSSSLPLLLSLLPLLLLPLLLPPSPPLLALQLSLSALALLLRLWPFFRVPKDKGHTQRPGSSVSPTATTRTTDGPLWASQAVLLLLAALHLRRDPAAQKTGQLLFLLLPLLDVPCALLLLLPPCSPPPPVPLPPLLTKPTTLPNPHPKLRLLWPAIWCAFLLLHLAPTPFLLLPLLSSLAPSPRPSRVTACVALVLTLCLHVSSVRALARRFQQDRGALHFARRTRKAQ